jgi:hypothetical protein
MSDLYDSDILSWSEHQASLLRRLVAGERPNTEAPDWTNIIEEIESVGREQLHSVESLLMRALLRRLKAEAWPDSRDVPHWRSEERAFLGDAAARFVPSMRKRIDLDRIYQRALRAIPETSDGHPPGPVPPTCPVTLDELLAE